MQARNTDMRACARSVNGPAGRTTVSPSGRGDGRSVARDRRDVRGRRLALPARDDETSDGVAHNVDNGAALRNGSIDSEYQHHAGHRNERHRGHRRRQDDESAPVTPAVPLDDSIMTSSEERASYPDEPKTLSGRVKTIVGQPS